MCSFLSSMEWYTQWLAKLFYCYYFLVHIYVIRLKFFVSFRHLCRYFSINPIIHIWSLREYFCDTLLLTFNRFDQSFDKVAIQIFWHQLLITMRPGLILGSLTLILNMHYQLLERMFWCKIFLNKYFDRCFFTSCDEYWKCWKLTIASIIVQTQCDYRPGPRPCTKYILTAADH